jgi:hypothetical protein
MWPKGAGGETARMPHPTNGRAEARVAALAPQGSLADPTASLILGQPLGRPPSRSEAARVQSLLDARAFSKHLLVQLLDLPPLARMLAHEVFGCVRWPNARGDVPPPQAQMGGCPGKPHERLGALQRRPCRWQLRQQHGKRDRAIIARLVTTMLRHVGTAQSSVAFDAQFAPLRTGPAAGSLLRSPA